MSLIETSQFAGGINNHLAKHLVPEGQAVDMLDCVVTSGAINPTKTQVAAKPVVDGFAKYQNSAGTRSIVRWGNEFYWSDNDSEELGSTLGYVGISAPDTPLSIKPTISGNRFIGKYQYLVTFETDDGFESAATLPGFELNPAEVETRTEVRELNPEEDLQAFNALHYRPNKRYGYNAGARVSYNGRDWECIQGFYGELNQSGSLSVVTNRTRYTSIKDWQKPGQDSGKYWKDVTDTTLSIEGYDEIQIANIPKPTEAAVTKVNIYRTVADGGEFFLLDTVAPGTQNITDSIADSSLILGRLLSLSLASSPPIYRSVNGEFIQLGGKYMTEVAGNFYLANGSRVYISGQGDPHGYDPLNFREFDDEVTGIARLVGGVLVFTANRVHRLSGTTLADSEQIQIPVQQGCPNWRTITYLRNRPIWQSYDGVCGYSPYDQREGERVEIITENKYDFSRQGDFAFVVEDTLFLMFSNEAVCIDFRSGDIYRRTVTGKWSWYDKVADKMYLSSGGGGYTLLDGGVDRKWVYESPDILGDSLNTLKDFRRIWLDNDQDVVVNLIVDDKKVNSVTVSPARKPVYLPAGTIGKRLRLRLQGEGTLQGATLQYNKLR